MARTSSVTLRLSPEEHEWLRRKAHWEGAAVSDILRRCVIEMVREDGYLRPPDDEPQDFGYEKEMMEFTQSAGQD